MAFLLLMLKVTILPLNPTLCQAFLNNEGVHNNYIMDFASNRGFRVADFGLRVMAVSVLSLLHPRSILALSPPASEDRLGVEMGLMG
jgi:hypothetical protein